MERSNLKALFSFPSFSVFPVFPLYLKFKMKVVLMAKVMGSASTVRHTIYRTFNLSKLVMVIINSIFATR